MKTKLFAVAAALTALSVSSCTPDDLPVVNLEVSSTELSIVPDGSVATTFTVKCNADWTLVADNWITPSTKGEKASEAVVTVALNAGKNSEGATRTGLVIISAGSEKVTVNVTQEQFVAPKGIYNAADISDIAAALSADEPDLSKWADDNNVVKLYDDIDAGSLTCFPIEAWPREYVLDGDGHSFNVAISSTEAKVGIFKVVRGTVKNLKLTGSVNVEGELGAETHIGVLCGEAQGATIENCQNFATVTGKPSNTAKLCVILGGFVGKAMQGLTVKNCTNSADITYESPEASSGAYHMMAGVVGTYGNDEFTLDMSGCKNLGTISAKSGDKGNWNYAAGIISNLQSTVVVAEGATDYALKVDGCVSEGNIILTGAAKTRVGGVVGRINGYAHISNCNFSGKISLNAAGLERNAGGITSFCESSVQATVENNTFTGRIEAESGATGACYIGGITGSGFSALGIIQNCKTTKDAYVCCPKLGNVSMVCAQAKLACAIKDCKVAGTIVMPEETVVISASNYADWMVKGKNEAKSAAVVSNCGYNAE